DDRPGPWRVPVRGGHGGGGVRLAGDRAARRRVAAEPGPAGGDGHGDRRSGRGRGLQPGRRPAADVRGPAGQAGPGMSAAAQQAAPEARPGSAALEVCDLRVRYGEVLAVAGASLRVDRGQVVALIGETGSGKSSLALGAARLLAPSAVVAGTVRIAGTD